MTAAVIQHPTVRTILENRINDREVNRKYGNATGKEKPFESALNQEAAEKAKICRAL